MTIDIAPDRRGHPPAGERPAARGPARAATGRPPAPDPRHGASGAHDWCAWTAGYLVDGHVAFETRHFFLGDVLADLAAKLLDGLVWSVLLEFPQHSGTQPGNCQDVGIGRCVQIDWDEDVLLQPRKLLF